MRDNTAHARAVAAGIAAALDAKGAKAIDEFEQTIEKKDG